RHVAELQESEERFRSAFDYAAIGMALVSPDGRWLQVNRSLCGIVGYTEQELLGMDFQAITHPDDLGTLQVHVGQLLDGQIPTYQTEKRYFHKDGHEV
ncbi:MAG: PAS domain S-box protein, partial [Acidobacteriota bacterium]|nr:PAS domain S-box protein [Acidobacteriota bacterium]